MLSRSYLNYVYQRANDSTPQEIVLFRCVPQGRKQLQQSSQEWLHLIPKKLNKQRHDVQDIHLLKYKR